MIVASFLISVWKEGMVLKEWIDAILIPILKKGDLKNCDN